MCLFNLYCLSTMNSPLKRDMCDLYITCINYKVQLCHYKASFIDINKIATNLIKIDIFMLQCVEVSSPQTIDIAQYLNTNNFSVNNRHFLI